MTPEEQVDIIAKNIGLKAIDQFWITFDNWGTSDHLESTWVTGSPE